MSIKQNPYKKIPCCLLTFGSNSTHEVDRREQFLRKSIAAVKDTTDICTKSSNGKTPIRIYIYSNQISMSGCLSTICRFIAIVLLLRKPINPPHCFPTLHCVPSTSILHRSSVRPTHLFTRPLLSTTTTIGDRAPACYQRPRRFPSLSLPKGTARLLRDHKKYQLIPNYTCHGPTVASHAPIGAMSGIARLASYRRERCGIHHSSRAQTHREREALSARPEAGPTCELSDRASAAATDTVSPQVKSQAVRSRAKILHRNRKQPSRAHAT